MQVRPASSLELELGSAGSKRHHQMQDDQEILSLTITSDTDTYNSYSAIIVSIATKGPSTLNAH